MAITAEIYDSGYIFTEKWNILVIDFIFLFWRSGYRALW